MARYSALTLAALAMTSQLLGVVHLALVNHVACAEHGDLIETGASLERAPAASADTTVGALDADGHGHDHCVIALLRRRHSHYSVAQSAPLRLSVARVIAFVDIHGAPAAPIDLLSVAPKNSPTI